MADDTRVAYGARCFWWGPIRDVGTRPVAGDAIRGGLPCCPHCGGMLFEVAHETIFLASAQTYQTNGHSGYVAFIEWAKGRCFPTIKAAAEAYRAAGGVVTI